MASFTLTQSKDEVEHLGRDVYHDTKGHNTLSADISGSSLSRAWVEMSLDGGSFVKMETFGGAEYKQPLTTAYDGIALDNVSVRETVDVHYKSDDWTELKLVWGEQGSPGTVLNWANSTNGDPTAFGNKQQIISEPDRAEDPTWFYQRPTNTLYLIYENSDPHGEVAVYPADSRDGISYSNKQYIGRDEWELDQEFASPTVWKYNGDYFGAGETHSITDKPLMVAKGLSPLTYENYIISAEPADFSDMSGHINFQHQFIDKNGKFHSYTSTKDSNSVFYTRYFSTTTYRRGMPDGPWTMSSEQKDSPSPSAITRFFNDVYVYGASSGGNAIMYWHLDGSLDERSLSSSGGSVSWEYYEPTVYPGATIDWRVAVEDSGGNVQRSTTKTFTVGTNVGTPYAARTEEYVRDGGAWESVDWK